jgi:hypothetical protein
MNTDLNATIYVNQTNRYDDTNVVISRNGDVYYRMYLPLTPNVLNVFSPKELMEAFSNLIIAE